MCYPSARAFNELQLMLWRHAADRSRVNQARTGGTLAGRRRTHTALGRGNARPRSTTTPPMEHGTGGKVQWRQRSDKKRPKRPNWTRAQRKCTAVQAYTLAAGLLSPLGDARRTKHRRRGTQSQATSCINGCSGRAVGIGNSLSLARAVQAEGHEPGTALSSSARHAKLRARVGATAALTHGICRDC